MITWEQPPKNAADSDRRHDLFTAFGHTTSEFGVRLMLERVSEYVIARAAGRIIPNLEQVVETMVCVDYVTPGVLRKLGRSLSMPFDVRFLSVYPERKRTPGSSFDRRNDLFVLRGAIDRADVEPFYSDDRPTFAARLKDVAVEAWLEAWELRDRVMGIVRTKWPVKFWIHGEPGSVWELTDAAELRSVHNLGIIDESIVGLA